MGALWYPGADRSQDRSKYTGITMSKIDKLVLHSTETAGWPGYPTFAPQVTYNPWGHTWRQHFAINRSASTLADPSSTAVRENRDSVCQVEIVGYCDAGMSRKYGHSIQNLDDRAYSDLAAFAAWLHREWGLPLRSTVRWVSYPASYGSKASQRLSGPAFDAYTGILGHQHVSGNDHGDPGVLDAARLVRLAQAPLNPNTQELPMATATHIRRNRNDWQVLAAAGEHALAIDEPAKPGEGNPVSLYIGTSTDIDLRCIVQVDGLSAGQTVEVYFARVYYDPVKKVDVVDARYRNPGQVDIAGRADGRPANGLVVFADQLAKHDPAFRLRVFINTPKSVRVRTNSKGWAVE